MTMSGTTSRRVPPNVGERRMSANGGMLPSPRGRAQVLLDQRTRLARIEIAGNRQHGVIGAVVRREEVGDVVQARRRQIFHRPEERVMERMAGRIGERGETLGPRTVRLVVHAPAPLVLTTSRCVSSFCWVIAGSRPPMRSASSHSANASSLDGTVS